MNQKEFWSVIDTLTYWFFVAVMIAIALLGIISVVQNKEDDE